MVVGGGGGDTVAKVGGWEESDCLLIMCLFVECLLIPCLYLMFPKRLVITGHCLVLQTLKSRLTEDQTTVTVSSG